MNEHVPDNWPVTFRDTSDALVDSSLSATPAQRLAWLEAALTLAFAAGALPVTDGEEGPLRQQIDRTASRTLEDLQ